MDGRMDVWMDAHRCASQPLSSVACAALSTGIRVARRNNSRCKCPRAATPRAHDADGSPMLTARKCLKPAATGWPPPMPEGASVPGAGGATPRSTTCCTLCLMPRVQRAAVGATPSNCDESQLPAPGAGTTSGTAYLRKDGSGTAAIATAGTVISPGGGGDAAKPPTAPRTRGNGASVPEPRLSCPGAAMPRAMVHQCRAHGVAAPRRELSNRARRAASAAAGGMRH